jgi:hypothetical protein
MPYLAGAGDKVMKPGCTARRPSYMARFYSSSMFIRFAQNNHFAIRENNALFSAGLGRIGGRIRKKWFAESGSSRTKNA